MRDNLTEGHERLVVKICRSPLKWFVIIGLVFNLSCNYIKNVAVQSEYSRIQKTDPSMLNLKHMISQDTFFVYGKVLDSQNRYGNHMLGIVAFSDRFQQHEIVDVMHQLSPDAYFGLNLPPGTYDLTIFADLDYNGSYESNEVIGLKHLALSENTNRPKVKGNIDISLGKTQALGWPTTIEVKTAKVLEQSLFFPPGTIRQLDDSLFDSEMSTLGMYHPAAFLDRAKTMFYALEEYNSYKIPVIFVHGIRGSARDFKTIISQLDRTRFQPWFFHYPSGGDLDQMAEFFYNIFLSGKVISVNEKIPVIVVAHSMGGLVVREALNRLDNPQKRTIHFISMATPFSGHPAAASGERKGLIVLPSWRDLNPANKFIKNLYRKPLPPSVAHHLIYAYGNQKNIKLGENSDGVVPLSSQLNELAQKQSIRQTGFNTSHTGILQEPGAIRYLTRLINQTKTKIPKANMYFLLQGGFDVPLDKRYNKIQAHLIRTYGKIYRALAKRQIKPETEYETEFLKVTQGKQKPKDDPQKSWMKFIIDYPNWSEMD